MSLDENCIHIRIHILKSQRMLWTLFSDHTISNHRKQEQMARKKSSQETKQRSFLGTIFGGGADTRDESDYSTDNSESSDSREAYPYMNQAHSQTFESDADTLDNQSLLGFDREMRSRHAQACKYMRVSALGVQIDQPCTLLTTCRPASLRRH